MKIRDGSLSRANLDLGTTFEARVCDGGGGSAAAAATAAAAETKAPAAAPPRAAGRFGHLRDLIAS